MNGEHSRDGSCDSCDERDRCEDPKAQDNVSIQIEKIKHKIVVGSGKGGVGKSTLTVNLAAALKRKGFSVGILDSDITGPNIPTLLGLEGHRLTASSNGIEPVNAGGIKVVSMGLLLENQDSAVVWRGPMKMAAIKQFISEVNWGDLDFLLVDLPPGTGDEPISVVQLIPNLDGTVVVTTPQEVALLDSRKAINMFRMMKVPVIGIVENMSGLICPHCNQVIDVFNRGGGERTAKELEINFLGAIPLDIEIGKLGDEGVAFDGRRTDAGEALEKIVTGIIQKIQKPELIPA